MKYIIPLLLIISGLAIQPAQAQIKAQESDYYQIVTLPLPEGMLLEVGGMTTLEDGRVALCTRRGEVWIVENPDMYEGAPPRYTLFAEGLHEPLGLAYRDNALYTAQRGELTKLIDSNGDGAADMYKTIFDWPLSGHYHEYSFGPKFLPDGSMIVTGNVAFGDQEWWRGESRVPWRGWAIRIWEDGRMEPWATGMRSPCGLGIYDGEFFYSDNQGDWMGSGGVWHMPQGAFSGHPGGLRWTGMENSPLNLSEDAFYARVDKRQIATDDGGFIKPENIGNERNPDIVYEVAKEFSALQPPAVWLPHGILGISNSEILEDTTGGAFGPFTGQLLVGDQGQSKIMRVAMEKVNGIYQGAAFNFRRDFQSGVLRMTWGNDGSLYVGETNRGWGSAGPKNSGLERLIWTGEMPLEMKMVRAMPDGFEIEFTRPVDKEAAANYDAYNGSNYVYKYHPVYGSPPINTEKLDIEGIKVSEDGTKVRLIIKNLRQHYVHQINISGLLSADGQHALLHPSAFYTLNQIPEGEKLARDTWTTYKPVKRPPPRPRRPTSTSAKKSNAVPTFAEVEPLLMKNTCTACHNANERQVGPAFKDVAKRGYSAERIVELIYKPEPQNWPDYTVPMAAMPQVPKAEALKIAKWINSLK